MLNKIQEFSQANTSSWNTDTSKNSHQENGSNYFLIIADRQKNKRFIIIQEHCKKS